VLYINKEKFSTRELSHHRIDNSIGLGKAEYMREGRPSLVEYFENGRPSTDEIHDFHPFAAYTQF
jgi:hypothetical protein